MADRTGRAGNQPADGGVQELHEGRWRPAVPLPFYGFLHVTCWDCKRRFWGLRIAVQSGRASERYQRHYRGVHIEGRSR